MEIDERECKLLQNTTAVTSVSNSSEFKEGSNLSICILNLEFHFKKLYQKNKNNSFQSNEQRFLAATQFS